MSSLYLTNLPTPIANFQKAFDSMDVEALAACFNNKSVFKGTNENKANVVLRDPSIVEYFKPFIEKRSSQVFKVISCDQDKTNSYKLSGLFWFTNKGESEQQVKPVMIDVTIDDETDLFSKFSSSPAPEAV